jgi:hypothetical protein
MSSPAKLSASFEILKTPEVKRLFDEVIAKMEQTIQKSVQLSAGFGAAVQKFDSSAQGIKRAGDVMTAFGSNASIATQGVGTFRDGVLQLGTEAPRTESSLKNLGTAIAQNATSFGVFTASVFGTIASISNLQREEVKVEAQQLRLQVAQTRLSSAELALDDARKKGGVSAERIAILEARVVDARQRVGIETAKTEISQGDYNETLGAFVTQIVPQMVAAGGAGVQLFTNMSKAIKTSNISFSSIGTAIKGALGTFASFITGTRGMTDGLKNSGDALNLFQGNVTKTGGVLGGLKGAITGVPWGLVTTGALAAGAALFAIGTNAFGIRTALNGVGVEVGKQVPILKEFLDHLGIAGEKLEVAFSVMKGHFAEMSQGTVRTFNTAITEALENPIELFDSLGDKVISATGIIDESLEGIITTGDRVTASFSQINTLWDKFQSGGIKSADDMRVAVDQLDLVIANLVESSKTEFPQFTTMLEGLSKSITGKLADNLITQDEFNEVFGWLKILGPLIDELKKRATESKTSVVDLGVTFKAADALAAGFLQDIPPALLETDKGLIQVQARLKAFVEQLKQRAETPEGKWITPEFIALFEQLVGIDLSGNIKDVKDLATENENLAKSTEDAWKKEEELTKEFSIQQRKLDEINAVYGTHLNLQNTNIDMVDKLRDATIGVGEAFVGEEIALLKLATTHGVYNRAILESANNREDDRTQINEIIASEIKYADVLTKTELNLRLVSEGHRDGAIKAYDFAQGLVKGRAEAEAYRAGLEEVLNSLQVTSQTTLGDLIPSYIELTNEELETLAQTFSETGHVGEALANIMNTRMAPAFETFSGIVAGMKDSEFRDAFKEIDFGDLNTEAWKDLKNMAKDMEDITTEGTQMLNIINALRIGVNNDSLKNSTIRQMLDEFGESLQNVIDIDPDGAKLSWFPKFLDDLSKGDRKAIITLHGDALQYLATALIDKNLTPEELIAFYEKMGISMNDSSDAAVQLRTDIDDLKLTMDRFKEFQKTGKGVDTGMDIEDIVGQQGNFDLTIKDEHGNIIRDAAGNFVGDTGDMDQSVQDVQKAAADIAKGLQGVQTAAKNMTDQVSNSMSILVNNMKPHTTTILTYLQSSQTAFANLAIQGGNSLAILVKSAKAHVTTLQTYFGTTVPDAIQKSVEAFVRLGLAQAAFGGGGGDLTNVKMPEAAGGAFPWANKGAWFKISSGGGGGGGALSDSKNSMNQFMNDVNNPLIAMQKQNMSGAGQFDGMIKAAAAASKGIQTEFSSMFTALQGIFVGVATEWSKDMNSLGTNAASGNSQVQDEFSSMFEAVSGIFLGIAEAWSADMNSLGANAASGSSQVQTEFSNMFSFSNKIFVGLANKWEIAMKNVLQNAKAASKQTNSAFDDMGKKAWHSFVVLANNWEKAMKNMVQNAKAAASQINSALAGIKDQEVTIHVGLSGPGVPYIKGKGDVWSLAQGGIISAAGGSMLTTHGPQLLLIGDNPGGKETFAAIPHNDPLPTVRKLVDKVGGMLERPQAVSSGARNFGEMPQMGITNALINAIVSRIRMPEWLNANLTINLGPSLGKLTTNAQVRLGRNELM